jgi:hypothetical protein
MNHFIMSITLLALSAPSLFARVDSPEDTSLIASSPTVTAGRAVTFNNRGYFVVDDGVHGEELWSSDGTDGGHFCCAILIQDRQAVACTI